MAGAPAAVGRETVVRVCTDSEAGYRVLSAAHEVATETPVVEVGSTGFHGFEPLVGLTHDGTTAFHPDPSPERTRTLVEDLAAGSVSADDALAVVDHDPDRDRLPTPDDGPLSVGSRRVLGRCGWVAPAARDDYGAFAVDRVGDDPTAALETVRDAGLLGRGRGDGATDAPLAPIWETARDADGDPVVVVNANESERDNRTDRTLLGGAPLAVLDGAVTVARVVGAEDLVVYLNESDEVLHRRVETAIAALGDADWDVSPTFAAGPDRYIAGEETMALEALEGNDRLEARLRPPGPEEYGLYGRPTVVHTPRTLAQIRELLTHPDAFDPDDADPGTRLVSVGGDVDAPATFELPTGGSLAAVREGVDVDGEFKMACVGGRFGGLTRTLDVSPSAPALRAGGLGTEGVVELLNRERCAVATAGNRARFAKEENCGRCVPCREGSKQLTELLRDVYDGTYQDDMLRELTRVMRETSTCGFGRHAQRPVTTAMAEFEPEFSAHADGRCPAGECAEAGDTS